MKNNKNNEKQAESKEKQVRKIARKKNKEEEREYRNKKGNGEWRKTEWIKREVRKQECDKACTNRLLPSLPLNSLLSSKLKDLRLSHLGPFFQNRQFLWQNFPVRLPTLEIVSFLGLKFARELSLADQSLFPLLS